MDRADLSSAIRQEKQAVVEEALEAVVPEMVTLDLATLEQRVQQVGRVLVLEAFDGRSPASLIEIARRTGLSEATVLRYLSSLMRHGWIERDEVSGRYSLGIRLAYLGQCARNGRPIAHIAVPVMQKLLARFQETVNLAARYDHALVIV